MFRIHIVGTGFVMNGRAKMQVGVGIVDLTLMNLAIVAMAFARKM
jgi:hypothetical protein